jgi:ABC-type transport system involved in multi-copper enzyme maturation permease subunit
MIGTIAEKEIRSSFKDLKFLFSSVLVIILMILCGLFYLDEYSRKKGEYDKNETVFSNEKSIKKIRLSLEPNPLGFVVEGKEKNLPSFLLVEPGYVDDRGGVLKPLSFLFNFENMDWLFIIGVVGSLIVMVFTFDAINGEKERGTLKLCLSNSVSKSGFLSGKFLGVSGSLAFPLAIGLLLNLILITYSGKIELTTADWMKIAMAVFVVALYISLFILFGFLMSTLSHKSSVSLVLSFLVWIAMINILPGSSGLLANILYPIPSPKELNRKCLALEQTIGERVSTGMLKPIVDAPLTEEEKRGRLARLSEELSLQQETENLKKKNRVQKIRENYNRQRAKQTEIARMITALSPYGLFSLSMESLALGGYRRYTRFLDAAYDHTAEYAQYVADMKRKYKDQAEFLSHGTAYYGGYELQIAGSRSYDDIEFDFRDFPRFVQPGVSPAEALKDALWYLCLLLLWNLLLGGTAYFKFIRFDPR